MNVLDVYFTVDVEIWCDGWDDPMARFPAAFERYIYGRTPRGAFGLPYQLKLLSDHGVAGTFFVEALFASCFGIDPLAEIVGMIQEAGHHVDLHVHTEWLDEAASNPLGDDAPAIKRQLMRHFDVEEQCRVVAAGLRNLNNAGAIGVNAFRAGSFGFNIDTLTALARNHIFLDCSYNPIQFGPDSGVAPGRLLLDAAPVQAGIYEFPMTVFRDVTGRLRHAQLGACSYEEIESALWRALDAGRQTFVVLSHNFELLNQRKDRVDAVVEKRFRRLCALLDRNRDCFRSAGFRNWSMPITSGEGAGVLQVPYRDTITRFVEQAWRRTYK